jgi:hypothetical protein
MNFSFTIVVGLLGACLAAAAPKGKAKTAAAAQLAAAQDAKIQAFLNKLNANNAAAQNTAVAKLSTQQKAALQAKKQAKIQQVADKKAAKQAAKAQAKKDAKAAMAAKLKANAAAAPVDGQVQVAAAGANQIADPDIYSASSSFSFRHARRHATHFSHSESEHFKDNETWSSCSHSHSSSSSCHHKKHPRYAYRLRHNRVRVEKLRQNQASVSNSSSESGEVIIFEASASNSFDASHKFKRTAVLRICEDELARRDNKTCARGRRRSSGSSSYERIDFRKKVTYKSDTETETSFSESSSFSLEIAI